MYADINGNKLYYEVHGKEDGEAIFFIHGAPGLGDCRGDIKSFSSLGDQYKLIFLDMRGSGRSGDNPPFTHEQWTADIDALRQSLNLDQIKILGGSYGGFLTLEYVLRYPEHVTHVMLRDTAASTLHHERAIKTALESDLPLNRDQLNRLFRGEIQSNDELKEAFASIQPLYTVEYDEEHVKQRIDSIYYHYQTHNYAFRVNQPKYDVVRRLKEINVPVLVTVGRHDWITPVDCSVEIAKEINHSTLVIFENSGHSPQQEENDKYIKLVRDFLADSNIERSGEDGKSH